MAEGLYPGKTRCLYLSCPICGMSRPLNKKGTNATTAGKTLTKGVKGIQHFNKVDVTSHSVIQERACLGPPQGFKKTKSLTLKQVSEDPAFEWVKAELQQQCREILAALEGE
jgi:hypothetical protein